MLFTTPPLCWGTSLLVLMKDWPGIVQRMNFSVLWSGSQLDDVGQSLVWVKNQKAKVEFVRLVCALFFFCITLPKMLIFIFPAFGGLFCRKGGISLSRYSCQSKGSPDLHFEGSQKCVGVKIGVCRTRPVKGSVCKNPSPLCCFHVHNLTRL